MLQFRHCGIALFLLLLLAGCGGKVIIDDHFPQPVVAPLPYRVGIYYPPEFSNYQYQDEESRLTFQLGQRQKMLFEQVFEAMFLQKVVLTSAVADADDLDLILSPKLTQYAFLTPTETATEFFAVSIKYQIQLFNPEGEMIAFWPMVAYGKSRTKMINKNESLGEATSVALRDAAAAMVSQFHTVLAKEEWRSASADQPEAL